MRSLSKMKCLKITHPLFSYYLFERLSAVFSNKWVHRHAHTFWRWGRRSSRDSLDLLMGKSEMHPDYISVSEWVTLADKEESACSFRRYATCLTSSISRPSHIPLHAAVTCLILWEGGAGLKKQRDFRVVTVILSYQHLFHSTKICHKRLIICWCNKMKYLFLLINTLLRLNSEIKEI